MRLGLGMAGGFALLAAAAWAGLLGYAVSIPGGTGPLPLILGCAAVTLGVLGVRELARLSAMPPTAAFDGQVIARWLEEDNSENGTGLVPHIAIDDAQRAWTFAGWQVFSRVALGDLVHVTVNPRSGTLLDLRVRPPQRQLIIGPLITGPLTHGPVITEAEVAALVGPPVRTTPVPAPGEYAVICKGRDGTMSMVVVGGGFAALNSMIGRCAGRRLTGIGDEAWLVNKSRTVIVRVGAQIVKLTVSRHRAAGPVTSALVAIAAAVAGRLAHACRSDDQVPRR